MRVSRKAQIITVQFLIGLIVAVAIIVFLVVMANKILTHEEDWIGSYKGLVDEINSMSDESILATHTYLLKLQKDSAVIGFTTVKQNPSSRIGTGNFFYVPNPTTEFSKQVDVKKSHLFSLVELSRPSTCEDDSSCLCLCQGINVQKMDEENPICKNSPLEEPLYAGVSFYDNYKSFFSVRGCEEITCKKLLCNTVEGNFFSYSVNDFFNQYYRDNSGLHVTTEETHKGETYMTSSNRNVIAINNLFVPDFMYENGFALYRASDSSKGAKILGWKESSASLPIYISKLINGNSIVCVNPECEEYLNKALESNEDSVQDGIQATQEVFNLNNLDDLSLEARGLTLDDKEKKLYEHIRDRILNTDGEPQEVFLIESLDLSKETQEVGLADNHVIELKSDSTNKIMTFKLLQETENLNEYDEIIAEQIQMGSSWDFKAVCGAEINALFRPSDRIATWNEKLENYNLLRCASHASAEQP